MLDTLVMRRLQQLERMSATRHVVQQRAAMVMQANCKQWKEMKANEKESSKGHKRIDTMRRACTQLQQMCQHTPGQSNAPFVP